jgi:hypothetical protein
VTAAVEVLVVLLVPGILTFSSRWFVAQGVIARAFSAACTLGALVAVIAFSMGRIERRELVAFSVPAFQALLAAFLFTNFSKRHGRRIEFIGIGDVAGRGRTSDAGFSSLYLVLAIAIPLLVLGLLSS